MDNSTIVCRRPDFFLTFEFDNIVEGGTNGYRDLAKELGGVFIADVLHKEQGKDVVLVLGGIQEKIGHPQFLALKKKGFIRQCRAFLNSRLKVKFLELHLENLGSTQFETGRSHNSELLIWMRQSIIHTRQVGITMFDLL